MPVVIVRPAAESPAPVQSSGVAEVPDARLIVSVTPVAPLPEPTAAATLNASMPYHRRLSVSDAAGRSDASFRLPAVPLAMVANPPATPRAKSVRVSVVRRAPVRPAALTVLDA